jgi:hypothetical protein
MKTAKSRIYPNHIHHHHELAAQTEPVSDKSFGLAIKSKICFSDHAFKETNTAQTNATLIFPVHPVYIEQSKIEIRLYLLNSAPTT